MSTQRGKTPQRTGLGSRFTALLTSTAFANLGDGMVQTGAPLIAIHLTRSPAQVSLLTAAAWLPWVILGIPGGAVVDRVDRRHAQMTALAARIVLLAVGAAIAVAGHLTMPVLVTLVLLYGVTAVFAELGEAAIVPDLVTRDRLAAANSRVLATQTVANSFLGVPVAGLLVTAGMYFVLGVPAALGVAAVLALFIGVRGSFWHVQAPAADGAHRGGLAEVTQGLSFLVKHPVLRPMFIAGALFNMGSTGYMAVLVLWMVGDGSRMGLKPIHYTLLLTLFAVGAIVGSIVAERIIHRVGEVRMLLITFLGDSLMLLVPLLAPHPIPVAVAFAVLGSTNIVGNTITQSVRQRLTPKHLLGRVTGAGRTTSYGLMPIGAVLAGVVGSAMGLPVSLAMGAALCLIATAFLTAVLRQRQIDAHELPADEPAAA